MEFLSEKHEYNYTKNILGKFQLAILLKKNVDENFPKDCPN